MKYEMKDNTFTLFINDRKTQPNQPDYRGSGKKDGVECWVSAWKRISANGTELISGSFTPKDQSAHHQAKSNGYAPRQRSIEPQPKPATESTKTESSEFNDDIPF